MGNLQDFHLFSSQLLWLFSHVFFYIFGGIGLPSHCYRANQAVCSANTLQYLFLQCGFPPLLSVQWIATDPFSSAAGSGVMPTLGFVHCFCHKWCYNFCENIRNFSEICKKWEIINLILFSAGFCCTCCSDFPGHHCFYFTYVSSKFLLFA